MKSLFLLLLSLLSLGESTPSINTEFVQEETTTYYFIRHAEKKTGDKKNRDLELTEAGKARALRWAEVFKEVAFDHIYSTDTRRARSTAQPTATAQELEIEFYDAKNLFKEAFQKKTQGKLVLIVGHSNTNPEFVNKILGEEKYKEIEDAESGSLYIVTKTPAGIKTSTVLYIN